MKWYNFILSHKKCYSFTRHLVFWLLWWMYFTGIYFHYHQTGLQQIGFEKWNAPLFIKSIVLVSFHVFICYSFINFLLPAFLLKARYTAMTVSILILCVIIVLGSYYLHKDLFPLIDTAFNHNPSVTSQNLWWTSISAGILSSPKVVAAATFIKLIKRWYLKQKEKERLEKEKLQADLQLLKAQIRPEFLFSSLDSLYSFAQTDTQRAAHLLLKLSDLLSYTLYESNKALVALDREISLIKDYLAVIKTRKGNYLEMDISVNGETGDKMISPLLLLPFIEDSFSYCGDQQHEKCWINIEFRVELQYLTMKLINGKDGEITTLSANENGLINVKKRLETLYSGKYELKRNIEPEMVITYLKIDLPKPSCHKMKRTLTQTE